MYSKSTVFVRFLGIIVLLGLLFVLKPHIIAAPLNQEGGLFAALDAAGVDDNSEDDPQLVRARFVRPDLSLLWGTERIPASDTLILNLFPDVVLTATRDHAALNRSGSFSWIGHVEGVPYSSVTLVIKEATLMGTVKMPGAFYRVRYGIEGMHVIEELNEAAFPSELEPLMVDRAVITPSGHGTASLDGGLLQGTAPMGDDGSTIDVLVVYTQIARTVVGGTTAMEALIDLAVAETNQSYANSGITQRVNLVHTAEVVYDETGFDWYTALNRLTVPTDGYMDSVHGLRDAHCADEVVLVVANTASCGIAWMQAYVSSSFASNAFAVVSQNCATGYYSFAHEMGHNMGARHDWYVDDSTTPYSYSHAFVNPTDRWRTIMAYNSECYDQGFNCSRLQYWSNPTVTYGGDPMGVPGGTSTACVEGNFGPYCDADNHRTLNNTAYTVANFRDSAVCNASTYAISGYVRNTAGTGVSGVTVAFGGARPAVTTNSSGYYSQSDFGNGDYTVSFSQPGYFFSPVEDQVTVNGAGVTHDATRYPVVPASVPFSDGFESASLGSHWAVETDYEGRVRVSSLYPYQGSYSLLLDDAVGSGFYSHAAAILALDLLGETSVNLSFWWQDFDDEDHTDDGVFISDDYGATWYKAFSFSGAAHPYTQTVIDLDAAASAGAMSLNDHVLVKFQFYDNGAIATDGFGIDNVTVAVGAVAGPLSYSTHLVDDDSLDQSSGNADAVANCGETIELYVDLYNEGNATATAVTTILSTADAYVTLTHNTVSAYPDIPGLGTRRNTDDFEVEIDPATPHGHAIHFTVNVTADGGGPWSDSFDVAVNCADETYTYLPLAVRNYSVVSMVNGNFEAGATGWTEYSTHGWDLIVTSFAGSVTPHGGSWAVWLGGDYDDISYIQQQVTVPSSTPYLTYWHWIASDDLCGYDFGGVIINDMTVVDVYNLCESTSTGGWVKHAVNLSAYAGQTVSLQIRAETDASVNSNLFVDDVSFQASAAALDENRYLADPASGLPRRASSQVIDLGNVTPPQFLLRQR